jgi:transposase
VYQETFQPKEAAMVYVGMDIHKEYSQVAVMDAAGTLLDERRLVNEREVLEDYFGTLPAGSEVALEATCGWGWVSDLLEACGLVPRLVHSAKARAIAECQIRTDTLDARTVGHLLRTGYLPEAYRTNATQRMARDLLRYRMSLVVVRHTLKCRIHALLLRLGHRSEHSDLFGKSGRAWLKALELAAVHRQILDGYLALLDALAERLGEVERDIRERVQENPVTQRLKTIPGIGDLLAYLLWVEMAEIGRFPSAKKLSAYAGLVPSTHQSGARLVHGPLIAGGNRYLRWAMVEAAQGAVRWDPSLRAFYLRKRQGKGASVAMAAVAHKLLIAVYHIWKYQEPYQGKSIGLGHPG